MATIDERAIEEIEESGTLSGEEDKVEVEESEVENND